jgi:hypothetical protein
VKKRGVEAVQVVIRRSEQPKLTNFASGGFGRGLNTSPFLGRQRHWHHDTAIRQRPELEAEPNLADTGHS